MFTGEGGVDGDGDITRPENITAFRNFVLENTDNRGLHCLMADGVRLSDKAHAHFCNKLQLFKQIDHSLLLKVIFQQFVKTLNCESLVLCRASLWKVKKISRRS